MTNVSTIQIDKVTRINTDKFKIMILGDDIHVYKKNIIKDKLIFASKNDANNIMSTCKESAGAGLFRVRYSAIDKTCECCHDVKYDEREFYFCSEECLKKWASGGIKHIKQGYKAGHHLCGKCNTVSLMTVVDTSDGEGKTFAYWCNVCEDRIDKSAIKKLQL